MSQTTSLPRIQKITVDGQPAWIKRRETLTLRLRLQKGNPDRAFHAELAALRRMAGHDLPVPHLLRSDESSFVIDDGGPNLQKLIRKRRLPDPERNAALVAAATALARLHNAGFSHGRPSLRDICWKDGRITLIDFERAHPKRDTPSGHATDTIMLFHSMIGVLEELSPPIFAARAAYIENTPAEIWDIAVKRMKRVAFLARLGTPVLTRMSHKPEFASIAPTVTLFTRNAA